MKDIRLIIFDLDGTLVDAYTAIIKSFNYSMRRLGYPRQIGSVIRRAVGWGDANLLKPFVKLKDLKKALLLYRRHHKKSLLKYSCLYPKVEMVLGYLKDKGYKLAIASNRPTNFSWILIRQLRLDRFFAYVLCADKLKHGKPHPDILNRIRQRFSVRPSQTLYIGDMTIDAQAARRAKVKAIIITTGSSKRAEIKQERPQMIIRRIIELLKIL